MNIQVVRDKAGWIVDDIADDYIKHTRHKYTGISSADLCWALSLWDFEKIVRRAECPTVVTIHHVDMKKLRYYNGVFNMINSRAKAVLVPNIHTYGAICDRIKRPIFRIPYWLLSKRMGKSDPETVKKLRQELLGGNEMLIGSFQKDSDTGTNKPKLSKGPDVFAEVVGKLHKDGVKAKVVLTGYARRYICGQLEKRGVPYVLLPRSQNINDLYDCLDWYLVTSRFEGGPQALLEASYRQVKILSTDVGLASGCLHHACLCGTPDDFVQKIKAGVDYRDRNFEIVSQNFTAKHVIPRYDDAFEQIKNGTW